jgi:hypothetical protein
MASLTAKMSELEKNKENTKSNVSIYRRKLKKYIQAETEG